MLQADICRLPQNLVQFDAVLVANVLDRLATPAALLDRLSSLVRPGGVVVLASAFSWSQLYTPKESWLGGFYQVCRQILICTQLHGVVQHASKLTTLLLLYKACTAAKVLVLFAQSQN